MEPQIYVSDLLDQLRSLAQPRPDLITPGSQAPGVLDMPRPATWAGRVIYGNQPRPDPTALLGMMPMGGASDEEGLVAPVATVSNAGAIAALKRLTGTHPLPPATMKALTTPGKSEFTVSVSKRLETPRTLTTLPALTNNRLIEGRGFNDWSDFLNKQFTKAEDISGHKLYTSKQQGLGAIVGPDGSISSARSNIIEEQWLAIRDGDFIIKAGVLDPTKKIYSGFSG